MSNKIKDVRTLDALGDAACYTQNAAELLAKLNATVPVTPDGKRIRLDFKTVLALLQAFWDQFKSAAENCAGKKVEVPNTGIWNIARSLLALAGIRL